MNEYDSGRVAGILESDGMIKTNEYQDADILYINTCTIRENADNKLYGTLGELKKWKEEVEIKEIYKGKEKVAVIKGKPNDIKQAKDKLDSSLDTMYNVLGPHDVSTTIDSIERYVDKLDRLIIKGTRAGAWAMNILKKNRKVKADYDFDLSSRKQKSGMMRMGRYPRGFFKS